MQIHGTPSVQHVSCTILAVEEALPAANVSGGWKVLSETLSVTEEYAVTPDILKGILRMEAAENIDTVRQGLPTQQVVLHVKGAVILC